MDFLLSTNDLFQFSNLEIKRTYGDRPEGKKDEVQWVLSSRSGRIRKESRVLAPLADKELTDDKL